VCDLETSRMGAPYIYDISTLRVNDLTFILLTWRKWLAPNNASRQQMGFNSGFKGLSSLFVCMVFHRPVLPRLCYDLISRNTVGECLGLVLANALLHQKLWCVGWNNFTFYLI